MERLRSVEWGEYRFRDIFNHIEQGRRLKKEDQRPGDIPFVMSGITNTGVVGYVSNPVARFPKNSITIDIFGNAFFRDYSFGAGDDTGVYWNDKVDYSRETMLFFTVSMGRSLAGKYSYGNKLRSSQSLDFKMQLPVRNGSIDFEFIDSFIAELQAQRIAELQAQRIAELQAYLMAAGLTDYTLTEKERKAVEAYENKKFGDFGITDIFIPKNTGNILSEWIVENSGTTPYLCASSENNGVSSYISYDEQYLDKGNCVFIGGKTFEVSYQEKDFFSNDSHNLTLRLKEEKWRDKLTQLYIVTCVRRSLKHKYSWGDSVSNAKIKNDVIALPTKDKMPDYASMSVLISAIQKLVIKDVVEYADRKILLTKKVAGTHSYPIIGQLSGDYGEAANGPAPYGKIDNKLTE